MYIVVIGMGKVGTALTESLSGEGHDIVVIDNKSDVIENAVNKSDVMALLGNGATYRVQKEAGVEKAELLIAVTPSDELNILCCMIGRKIGAKNTIARVRNPEYSSQLLFMRNELGLSMMINPEYEAASEISRILRFPSASRIDYFAKGRVDLVEFKLPQNSMLGGQPINMLYKKTKAKVLVCTVQRDKEVVIPDGNFILQDGDRVSVAASHVDLASFFKNVGVFKQKIKNVLLIGGGKISYYLARQLLEIGISVKIIEQDRQRCMDLSDLLPRATIVCGDGTDQSLLLEEGITQTDACVALTGIDEENIIVSVYAAIKGVIKVVTKITRTSLKDILDSVGLESIISPKELTASIILRYVRALQNSVGSNIQTLHKLGADNVEALEFRVTKNVRLTTIALKNLSLKKNLLIASIIKRDRVVIPSGDDTLEPGDSVIVVTSNNTLRDLQDILA